MEEVINQTPEVKSQVDVVKERAKVKSSPFLVIMLVFFIILLGVLMYFFFTDKLTITGIENPLSKNVEEENLENEEVTTDDTNVEDQSLINIYSNGIIYFEYPDGWEITAEDVDYRTESDDLNKEMRVVVSNTDNPEYSFTYVLFEGDPAVCVFDDSIEEHKNLDSAFSALNYDGKYFTLGGYRVGISDDLSSGAVCKCEETDGGLGCGIWLNSGAITLGFEVDRDTALMKDLEGILSSWEYKGD